MLQPALHAHRQGLEGIRGGRYPNAVLRHYARRRPAIAHLALCIPCQQYQHQQAKKPYGARVVRFRKSDHLYAPYAGRWALGATRKPSKEAMWNCAFIVERI